ncbi:sericin 1 precursor-like protein [Synechococcus phage S-CAM22]|uniref:Sericin 1-like protein n=1 Tax=Synechococcus phage S-CAM22 TaxID=1883365 RepID=A0A1D8KQQ3_9CAUD|nr:sericin 1 precursor-like protein [Synechococcus phage S-CAM22]AOV60867.1 sericin 1 precursor-like protein [Synechococcus phage S-CAM22]
MSQLNVDALKHSGGTGSGIDLQSSGNFAFDTNTLYVDSVNDRIGINDSTPTRTLDVSGSEGINFGTAPLFEGVNIVGGTSNGNTNIDLLSGSVHLFTSNNTGNWTPNFRGDASTTLDSIMDTGQVIVATIISTNGGSSGYAANMNIDGNGQTEYWANDSEPDDRGGTSGYDVYQYSIIKTGSGNSYLVLANRTFMD